MATIKGVAELVGMPTATVSRVVSQATWVRPVARERVEKAMRKLNYHRSAAVIALAKRNGDILGLLTDNPVDPFFIRLARGMEEVSCQQQFRLMVCSGGYDEGMEKSRLDLLINQGYEAIVVRANRLSERELLRYAAHFPAMMVMNCYIAGVTNRCVWLENSQVAKTATPHPLEQGHRCITCMTSDLPIIDRNERLGGCRRVLAKYGITPDKSWVISVPFNEKGGERAAHQLLNCGTPFTAVVMFNDIMAVGIMRILHQQGITLPQRLSIVGSDDVVTARYLYPALTTMRYPIERMAHSASQLVIQLFKGATQRPSADSLTVDLVIRDSVLPPSF